MSNGSKQAASTKSLIRKTTNTADKRSAVLEITSTGWDAQTRINTDLSHFLIYDLLPNMDEADIKKHTIPANAVLGSGVLA